MTYESVLEFCCYTDYVNGACPNSEAQVNIPSIKKCVLYEDSNFTTWFEARARCAVHNGRLLEDVTPDIHNALQTGLQCWQDAFWVGASKVNWTWASGRSFIT